MSFGEITDLFSVTEIASNASYDDLEIKYLTTDNSCKIKFNKLGNYSVYEEAKSLNSDKWFLINDDNFYNYQTNKTLIFIESIMMDNEIMIKDLKPGATYVFYIYFSQEAAPETEFRKIIITTNPKTPVIKKQEVSSNKVKIKWQNDCFADEYQIYRNNKYYKTITNNTFTDKDVKSSTEYTYQIRAVAKTTDKNKYSKKSNKVIVNTGSPMALPEVSGECKTWANYQAVTARSSPQYKLLHSQECYTDAETGIRMVDDCYCVALGSYYGTTIGQKYLIKLSSGKEFKAILCDQKANIHTDATNRYALRNKDIIEFYIDRAYKPSAVDGSYNTLPRFSGSVISIEKIS